MYCRCVYIGCVKLKSYQSIFLNGTEIVQNHDMDKNEWINACQWLPFMYVAKFCHKSIMNELKSAQKYFLELKKILGRRLFFMNHSLVYLMHQTTPVLPILFGLYPAIKVKKIRKTLFSYVILHLFRQVVPEILLIYM